MTQPTDKQKWWWEKRFYNQFKRYILHGLSPVGEFEDSYDFNKLKSFISHVAKESKRIGAEEERRRILDEVREYCKQTCESYKQTGLFCSEDEDLQGILDILSNRTKP